MSNLEYLLYRMQLKSGAKKISNYYQSILNKTLNDEKYFFFAAPFQPEASSTISQGIFENLALVIDMISEALPSDSILYFKEHPSTFKTSEKGILGRSIDFYNESKI